MIIVVSNRPYVIKTEILLPFGLDTLRVEEYNLLGRYAGSVAPAIG